MRRHPTLSHLYQKEILVGRDALSKVFCRHAESSSLDRKPHTPCLLVRVATQDERAKYYYERNSFRE